jgi:hypothetical protein
VVTKSVLALFAAERKVGRQAVRVGGKVVELRVGEEKAVEKVVGVVEVVVVAANQAAVVAGEVVAVVAVDEPLTAKEMVSPADQSSSPSDVPPAMLADDILRHL